MVLSFSRLDLKHLLRELTRHWPEARCLSGGGRKICIHNAKLCVHYRQTGTNALKWQHPVFIETPRFLHGLWPQLIAWSHPYPAQVRTKEDYKKVGKKWGKVGEKWGKASLKYIYIYFPTKLLKSISFIHSSKPLWLHLSSQHQQHCFKPGSVLSQWKISIWQSWYTVAVCYFEKKQFILIISN